MKLHFPTPHPSLSLTAFFFDLRLITLKLQLFSKLELKLSKLMTVMALDLSL